MGFTCDFKKPSGFRGKDALLRQKKHGIRKKLICLSVDEDNYLWNLEPIYRDGKVAGYMRRTSFGFTVGKHVGYGYVELAESEQVLEGTQVPDSLKNPALAASPWEVEIGDRKRVPATFHAQCVVDPKGLRVQGEYDGAMF